jgi:exopolysaccharide biosynthesis polyprenyl glycosylphosphotransferase
VFDEIGNTWLTVVVKQDLSEKHKTPFRLETSQILLNRKKRDLSRLYMALMPLSDALLVFIGFRVAYTLRYRYQIIRPVDEVNFAPFETFLPYALIFAFMLVLISPLSSLYRQQRGRTVIDEVYRIFNGVTSVTVLVMALSFLLQPPGFSRLMIIISAVLIVFLLASSRVVYRVLRQLMRARGIGVENVLLVGAGHVGRAVISALLARPELGYRTLGYLDDNPERGSVDMGRVRGLGDINQLDDILRTGQVDLVVVALPWQARHKIMNVVARCASQHVQVRVVPDLFQLSMSQVRSEKLESIPLLGLHVEPRLTPTGLAFKRIIDIGLVLLTAPLVLLLTAIIGLAIVVDSRGPVFYAARRVGKDSKPFRMFKFRTMIVGADKMRDDLVRQTGVDPRRPKWEHDPRITRVGRWLRKTSLDELPNLLNVLRGEMSIVGPRPAMPNEVEHYEAWQKQRLNTHPGMTGLWQVSGRSKVPFEEQCLLDIYYIENWSIGLEIEILVRTIPNVLLGNGAY